MTNWTTPVFISRRALAPVPAPRVGRTLRTYRTGANALRLIATCKTLGLQSVLLVCAVILVVVFAPTTSFAADTVEFLNGSKATGTVKSIRKADKEFDFETKVGTHTFTRTYSFSKVHAVTISGKRFELTPKSTTSPSAGATPATRTEAEVKAIITAAGRTPPDWFDSTPLDYPETLDLSWPLKPPTKGWKPQKNMSQYIWSVINENPRRWRSGIKLLHHCITLHKDDTTLLQRDMQALGTMYFQLIQDYPRAAFWYQKANVPVIRKPGIQLAECYWRIGNQDMALKMMRGRTLSVFAVKLLGDMGEMDGALAVTQTYSKSNAANDAFLYFGDALRRTGKTNEAIKYYQRVVDSSRFSQQRVRKPPQRQGTRQHRSHSSLRPDRREQHCGRNVRRPCNRIQRTTEPRGPGCVRANRVRQNHITQRKTILRRHDRHAKSNCRWPDDQRN